MKTLIADNSVEMRPCIRELLSFDRKIIEAGSGREAVSAFHDGICALRRCNGGSGSFSKITSNKLTSS